MTDNGPHRKRVRHYEGRGDARSLTFSCYQRRAYLSTDRAREWMVDALELARRKHPIHIWAYVFMPEHVHLLLWPTSDGFEAKAFLSTVKQSVSKRTRNYLLRSRPEYLRARQGPFHFWQDGPGYDRNLTDAGVVWQTIEYIHANPVRRGRCLRPEDWYWSSAGIYVGLREGPLRIDRVSLPADPR